MNQDSCDVLRTRNFHDKQARLGKKFDEMASCHMKVEGNDDLYGLGVRLGTYLQWFGTALAFGLSANEAGSMRAVNTCFQVAMLISLIYLSARPEPSGFHSVEALIILLFCFGGTSAHTSLWSWRISQPSRSLASIKTTGLGSFTRLLVDAAICAYTVWFATRGLSVLKRTPCTEMAFFFAPVRLSSWYRWVLLALSCAGLGLATCLITLRAWSGFDQLKKIFSEWRLDVIDVSDEQAASSSIQPLAILKSCSASAIFILAIELTIAWNHIVEVYTCSSVSQLLPLLISATALIKLMYKLACDFYDGKLTWRGRARRSDQNFELGSHT